MARSKPSATKRPPRFSTSRLACSLRGRSISLLAELAAARFSRSARSAVLHILQQLASLNVAPSLLASRHHSILPSLLLPASRVLHVLQPSPRSAAARFSPPRLACCMEPVPRVAVDEVRAGVAASSTIGGEV
jgi:hypothetical protein